MGVDVNLYAVGEVTDDELAAAEEYMNSRVPQIAWRDDSDCTILVRDKREPNRIEVSTGHRYYGPGYERGHWPTISTAILCLRVALPHCEVFYGGDTTDDGLSADDDLITEYWLHFLGPDGDRYHQDPSRG
jgi:hypothetical protein